MKESKLSIRESAFETVMETMAQAIVIMDKDKKVIFFNQRYKNLFRHTDTELFTGAYYVDLLDIWAKRYGVDDKIYEHSIKNLNSKKPLITELNQNQFSHKDAYWIQMFHNPLTDGGAVRTFLDITERKVMEEKLRMSEKHYRLLADNAQDVIFTMDIDGKYTYISPSVERMRGYTPEEVLNQTLEEVLTPESAKIIRSRIFEMKKHLSKGKKIEGEIFEMELLCKDGSRVWSEVNTSAIYNSENQFVQISGVSRNISERKKAEEQMKKYTAELKELNATKDKFFSIIAHDLRNPLHGILAFAKMLSTEYHTLSRLDIQHSAEIIHRVASEAHSLLENLLEWAQSQTGKIPFHPEKLYLNYIINKQIEICKPSAIKKNISFNFEAGDDIMIYTDENMIKTILRNLISNAIKFTNINGSVIVKAVRKDGYAEISVIDNGIGIPSRDLPKLFNLENHYTVKGTENEPGTGLGLILCKEFVEKNGGEIKVSSEENKGSNFTFTIPVFK
ncbi:MAG TPA: PAS domain S-box protein [Ignavibacteria bacterium]